MSLSGPLGFLSKILEPITGLVDQLHTSDDERLEAKAVLLQLQTSLMGQTIDYEKQIAQSQRDIIVAETQANSWLTRSWRPITMLTLVAMVVIAQFSSTEIPPDLWFVIKLGLGGYVGGRSVEKSVASVVRVMKSKEHV
jgi:hypothetical protein